MLLLKKAEALAGNSVIGTAILSPDLRSVPCSGVVICINWPLQDCGAAQRANVERAENDAL